MDYLSRHGLEHSNGDYGVRLRIQVWVQQRGACKEKPRQAHAGKEVEIHLRSAILGFVDQIFHNIRPFEIHYNDATKHKPYNTDIWGGHKHWFEHDMIICTHKTGSVTLA